MLLWFVPSLRTPRGVSLLEPACVAGCADALLATACAMHISLLETPPLATESCSRLLIAQCNASHRVNVDARCNLVTAPNTTFLCSFALRPNQDQTRPTPEGAWNHKAWLAKGRRIHENNHSPWSPEAPVGHVARFSPFRLRWTLLATSLIGSFELALSSELPSPAETIHARSQHMMTCSSCALLDIK
jgi:hypothetical protein